MAEQRPDPRKGDDEAGWVPVAGRDIVVKVFQSEEDVEAFVAERLTTGRCDIVPIVMPESEEDHCEIWWSVTFKSDEFLFAEMSKSAAQQLSIQEMVRHQMQGGVMVAKEGVPGGRPPLRAR